MDGETNELLMAGPQTCLPVPRGTPKARACLPLAGGQHGGRVHGHGLEWLPQSTQKHQRRVRVTGESYHHKTWSSTQSSVSLSSGEAEFNGVVRGAGVGLGYRSLLRDLGHEVPLRLWTDSSAALGICSRQGLGRLRHLDTHTLWVQQAVRAKQIDLRKIAGEVNPADMFTKHSLTRERS